MAVVTCWYSGVIPGWQLKNYGWRGTTKASSLDWQELEIIKVLLFLQHHSAFYFSSSSLVLTTPLKRLNVSKLLKPGILNKWDI